MFVALVVACTSVAVVVTIAASLIYQSAFLADEHEQLAGECRTLASLLNLADDDPEVLSGLELGDIRVTLIDPDGTVTYDSLAPADELPNEDLFVSFMVEQKDVTDKLSQMGIYSMKPSRQAEFVDSLENAWSKDVKAKDSTLRLELKPFYEGNKYYATTYRDFRDVRLPKLFESTHSMHPCD